MWPRIVCLFLLTLTHVGWAQDKNDLIFSDSYFNATYPMANSAAGYFSLKNNRSRRITLTGVLVDKQVADSASLHQTVMNDGMMSMRALKQVSIDASEVIDFLPGGNHIMLMGLNRQLTRGDVVTVTFTFADDSNVTRQFTVKAPDTDTVGHHTHSD